MSSSGLPYYFVELTLDDGSQYVIQAYDDEAVTLYNNAMEILKQKNTDKS